MFKFLVIPFTIKLFARNDTFKTELEFSGLSIVKSPNHWEVREYLLISV